jgi:hypothetical protein
MPPVIVVALREGLSPFEGSFFAPVNLAVRLPLLCARHFRL